MPDIEKVRELQSKVMKDIAAGAIIPSWWSEIEMTYKTASNMVIEARV